MLSWGSILHQHDINVIDIMLVQYGLKRVRVVGIRERYCIVLGFPRSFGLYCIVDTV
jgi:hypothetical protein